MGHPKERDELLAAAELRAAQLEAEAEAMRAVLSRLSTERDEQLAAAELRAAQLEAEAEAMRAELTDLRHRRESGLRHAEAAAVPAMRAELIELRRRLDAQPQRRDESAGLAAVHPFARGPGPNRGALGRAEASARTGTGRRLGRGPLLAGDRVDLAPPEPVAPVPSSEGQSDVSPSAGPATPGPHRGSIERLGVELRALYRRLAVRHHAPDSASPEQWEADLACYDTALLRACLRLGVPTVARPGDRLAESDRVALTRALATAGLDVRSGASRGPASRQDHQAVASPYGA